MDAVAARRQFKVFEMHKEFIVVGAIDMYMWAVSFKLCLFHISFETAFIN